MYQLMVLNPGGSPFPRDVRTAAGRQGFMAALQGYPAKPADPYAAPARRQREQEEYAAGYQVGLHAAQAQAARVRELERRGNPLALKGPFALVRDGRQLGGRWDSYQDALREAHRMVAESISYVSIHDEGTAHPVAVKTLWSPRAPRRGNPCGGPAMSTRRNPEWQGEHPSLRLRLTWDQARSVSGPGPQDENVLALSRVPSVARQLARLDPESLRRELAEYGAWDDTELADHAQNLQRILWTSASNMVERRNERRGNPEPPARFARQYERLYGRTRRAMGGVFDWPTLKASIPGRAEELRRLWNLAYRESHPGFPAERTGNPEQVYTLDRDGKNVMMGTALEIAAWVHRHHSYSLDHALKHEGYTVTPVRVEYPGGVTRPGRVYRTGRPRRSVNPGSAWHTAAGREYAARVRADQAAGHAGAGDYWQGALAAESRALAVQNPEGAPHDFEVTELVNFAETTGALYNQRKSITQNQLRRLAKGQFNISLSAKLWRYWFDSAAKLMERETGWRPSTAVRQAAAERMASAEYDKMVAGEYGELPSFKTRTALTRAHYQGKRPNPGKRGAAAGFKMFHDADPDKAYKVNVPDGFPRKLYMIGRLARLVTDRGTISGGVLAAGGGDRMYVLGASKNLAGSARARQVEYIPPKNSRKAGALYYHKFTHAPLVKRHGSGGNYTIAGKSVTLTPRGIVG